MTQREDGRITDEAMLELGRQLREARKSFGVREAPRDGRMAKRGLSLRRFADVLTGRGYAIDWNTVQRYETGQIHIPASYILIVEWITGRRLWPGCREGSDA